MNTKELLLKIADVVLQSDEESADWIEVDYLRKCWYWLFFISFGTFALNGLIGGTPLHGLFANSTQATLWFRVCFLILTLAGTIAILVLALNYYKYILSKGAPIRFINVIGIYVGNVIFFGMTYFYIYSLKPSLFEYLSPPTQLAPTLSENTLEQIAVKYQFVIFSAFQSVNASFFKIKVTSSLVSVLSIIQFLFTLVLITLVVSSFVNQRIGTLKKDKYGPKNS